MMSATLDENLALIADNLDMLRDEVAALRDAVKHLLEKPRFNDFFESEDEARLAHALLNMARHGPDKSKYTPFPQDVLRKRMAALADVAYAEVAKNERRYATILEAEEWALRSAPQSASTKPRGGVDVGLPNNH